MVWGNWLDEYDREARLVPALFALLPLALAAVGLGLDHKPLLGAVAGALLAVGAPMLVAKQVASRGRELERKLFAQWGGAPTTLALVPPPDGPLGQRRQEWRTRLEQVTGIALPASPVLTPSDAEKYDAAIRWLISNTRDHTRFPVVWTELKGYGFERNLLALKPLGVVSAVVSAGILAAGVLAGSAGADVAVVPCALLLMLNALIAVLWWRAPSAARVRAAADRYAEQLLDGLYVLTGT